MLSSYHQLASSVRRKRAKLHVSRLHFYRVKRRSSVHVTSGALRRETVPQTTCSRQTQANSVLRRFHEISTDHHSVSFPTSVARVRLQFALKASCQSSHEAYFWHAHNIWPTKCSPISRAAAAAMSEQHTRANFSMVSSAFDTRWSIDGNRRKEINSRTERRYGFQRKAGSVSRDQDKRRFHEYALKWCGHCLLRMTASNCI